MYKNSYFTLVKEKLTTIKKAAYYSAESFFFKRKNNLQIEKKYLCKTVCLYSIT